MLQKKFVKIVLIFGAAILFMVAGFVFIWYGQQVLADVNDNTSGWAWSETIGWISFNCTNDHDEVTAGVQTCIDLGGADYGVSVDKSTGDFSKYVWSEHIGWIKFNPAAIPPGESAPVPALLDLTAGGTDCEGDQYDVCGWARACSVIDDALLLPDGDCEGPLKDPTVTGGWDGWISLRGSIVITDGLVAYWKLDDGAGSTASDSIGNDDGTLIDMEPATDWVPGSPQVGGGTALDFDGSNEYVEIVDLDGSLDITGDITIAAWVKYDSLTTGDEENRIVLKGSGDHASNLYTLDVKNGRALFNLHENGNAGTCGSPITLCVRGSTDILPGNWYHIVGTYDGSVANIYLNGNEIPDGTNSFTSTGVVTASSVPIGGRTDGKDMTDGIIDDVRIYNRALSPGEVADMYAYDKYGVIWSSVTQELEGWAWGSDVVGWISFNCLDTGSCATSNYKVIVDMNTPPTATGLGWAPQNYCGASSPPIELSWTFEDPDPWDLIQSAYQVQVTESTDPLFISPDVIDSLKKPIASLLNIPIGLSYDTTYIWRLMVWDSKDASSGWISGPSFTTQAQYPDPSVFDWIPDPPAAEEEVQFNDNNTFTGVPPGTWEWFWDFETDGTDDAFIADPVHIYPDSQNYSVTLRACADGRCCSSMQSLQTTIPFPEWREISPF